MVYALGLKGFIGTIVLSKDYEELRKLRFKAWEEKGLGYDGFGFHCRLKVRSAVQSIKFCIYKFGIMVAGLVLEFWSSELECAARRLNLNAWACIWNMRNRGITCLIHRFTKSSPQLWPCSDYRDKRFMWWIIWNDVARWNIKLGPGCFPFHLVTIIYRMKAFTSSRTRWFLWSTLGA